MTSSYPESYWDRGADRGGSAPPVLRQLAAAGALAKAAASDEDSRLRAEAYGVVLPLVWERHTRPLEKHKGHRYCASAVRRLAPECADGFNDDTESVVVALLSYSRPVENLEGWITSRMANAIKDGHRVRRSRDMGAQQRVRVPVRLQARLDNDPWLVDLAAKVLRWAGVRQTAGTQLWPLRAWADDRTALVCPARGFSSDVAVAEDLEVVLRTMREWDAAWYEQYVERPLGRKWAPVFAGQPTDHVPVQEPAPLELVPQHDRDDARLTEAASSSLATIRHGLDAGGEPRQTIADAIAEAFLGDAQLFDELDQVPWVDDDPGALVAALLGDEKALDRLCAAVLDIIG